MRPDNRPGSLLFSREKSASIGKADRASDTTLPWLLLICLALIIAGGGYFVFDQVQKRETQRVQQNLAAIADLKTNEINRWIEQNKTNAIITSRRSPVADRTQQWLDRGARPGTDLDWLRARLEGLRQIHSYGEMAILSASGRPLITTEPALPDVSDLQPLIDKAMAAGEPVVGDMRWNRLRRGGPYISVPIAAPMIASGEKGGNVGVLLIHADANHFLFPLIQSWPAPSETAETYIAKRADGYLLCLNELRHQKDSALKLHIPIDQPDSLAAKVFRGEQGLLSGIDYRGEPVIGYGTQIRETDWLMVAKVDQKEVYAPIRRAAITITVATLGLLLVSSLTLYLWWRQRNIINQAAQLQAEINQQFIAQQYETLSKHANDIILLMDENYRIVDANDRAEEAFGYSRAQLIGMSLAKLMLPQDKEELDRRWKELLQSRRLMFEITHVRSDGTVFSVEASTRVIEKGKQRFVQSVMRDISERKRIEQALRESEAQFRQVAEVVPQLVWMARPDGYLEYCNQRWYDYTGTSPEENQGDLWARLLHPDHYQRTIDAWKHSVTTGEVYSVEYLLRSKDGAYRWFLGRASPLRNERGEIVRWFGTSTDIHELKQAQEALKANEERLSLAQTVTRIGTFDWNIQSNVNVWSPEAEALYGMPPGSFGGTYEAWVNSLHPDDRARAEQEVKQALETGNYESEWRVIWPSGEVRWIAGRGQVFKDKAGQPLRLVGINIDLTERKQAEARERRLANMYRALGETNDAIIHLESETELFSLICRVAAEYGDMPQAWVGIPDEKQNFIPAASYGRAHDYLTEILQETTISCAPDRPEGRGPAGIAYREGRAFIANDFARDIEHVTPWLKAAQRHGIKSASVFPIKRAGRSYAVFVIYSEQLNAFDEEIVHLLNEIAGNVSFALDNIDRERERRQAEEELRLAALVYQESAEAMMVTDEANSIISVNPAFERLTGYKAADVTGKNPLILSSGRDSRAHYREMLQRLAKSNYWQGELWLSKKTGEEFVAAMSINSTFHPDGSVNRHVILFADVTRRKQAEELVWQQANFDTLTGLPNRRHFLDQLKQEIRKSRRSRLPLGLMFLDLDGFKDVNDTLGHEAGDLLLKQTAERLSKCVRETDTVARLGGDEFIIILSELRNTRHAEKVARHILHMLAQPFEIGKEVAHVSGSIGITFYPQDASNTDDLLFNADNAMYAAKQEGKNRYSFFTEAMQQAAQERAWMVNELRSAIDGKQFRLVYQPIVELASGCIKKAEALLRWEHPERGMIDPSVFIPVAEETGMIQEIGDWVFFEAANQVAKWRQAYHPDFQVSVNKSPVQFKSNADDLSAWFDHLKALKLPGQSIAVEITEGVLMDESQAVSDQLLAFRDAGIEVSLDDFGTGYSALSYLKRFDIDRLKIDRTFIRDLETDPNDQALCEAMIVMGHKLGIKVIAEGVETDRQREILADAGCDFVQGYLVSGAVSAEELSNLLKKGSSYCPGMPAV